MKDKKSKMLNIIKNFIKSSIIVGIFLFVLVNKAEAEVSYYIYDSPGRSVTTLTNASGTVVNQYEYSAFGDVALAIGSGNNNYTYVGEFKDSETNLVFLRHRYYDSALGRFITKDPLPGQKIAPSTLNSYAYCKNNPINLVDPLGLATLYYWQGSGDSEKSEGWCSHVSILLDDGTYISNWPAEMRSSIGVWFPSPSGERTFALDNAAEHGNPLYTIPINNLNEAAMKAWWESSPKNFSAWYNCSDVFTRALREGGYDMPHHFIYLPETVWKDVNQPSKSTPSSSRSPMGAVDYLLGKTPAYAAEIGGPSESLTNLGSSIYGTSSFMAANYGGVSLSKTASLLLDLTEVKGAVYDDKTGQIILLGKQNLALPQMKLDDLAVAVNSVYSGTDPGVSIDPPLVVNQFSVRYDGKTSATEFGYTMFESDRIMKTLALGKDNISGQPVSSSVTGYKNLLDRYRESNSFPEGESSHRFWFKPKEVKLVKSADGNSMVFDTATMECLTESKFQDNVIGDPESEAFAANLTQYYDDYAQERPIFKDLKKLGQGVSVVNMSNLGIFLMGSRIGGW